jgi:hypothetical protein
VLCCRQRRHSPVHNSHRVTWVASIRAHVPQLGLTPIIRSRYTFQRTPCQLQAGPPYARNNARLDMYSNMLICCKRGA